MEDLVTFIVIFTMNAIFTIIAMFTTLYSLYFNLILLYFNFILSYLNLILLYFNFILFNLILSGRAMAETIVLSLFLLRANQFATQKKDVR